MELGADRDLKDALSKKPIDYCQEIESNSVKEKMMKLLNATVIRPTIISQLQGKKKLAKISESSLNNLYDRI